MFFFLFYVFICRVSYLKSFHFDYWWCVCYLNDSSIPLNLIFVSKIDFFTDCYLYWLYLAISPRVCLWWTRSLNYRLYLQRPHQKNFGIIWFFFLLPNFNIFQAEAPPTQSCQPGHSARQQHRRKGKMVNTSYIFYFVTLHLAI